MVGLLAGSAIDAAAQDSPLSSVALPISACRFAIVGAGKVANILDGRTFTLDDGREVRMAAVEAPSPPGPAETEALAPVAAAAKAALAALLAGQSVELRHATSAIDRYGRTLAHAYFTRDGIERSAGHEMLAQGYARVSTHIGNPTCAAELLSRERAARSAKLGLWADPYYGIVEAGSGAALLAGKGRFTVAEGKVLSVRESGGTIYMNFGRRWSEALTVTILKRHERIFAQAGLPPKTLQNRRIRVRGWIDERNGPRIEASYPEQIEIAELN
jgi:endonuclease YncB( thermonuclease family)